MKNIIGIVLCLFFLMACKAETPAEKPERNSNPIEPTEKVEYSKEIDDSKETLTEELVNEVRPIAEDKKESSAEVNKESAISMPEKITETTHPESKKITENLIDHAEEQSESVPIVPQTEDQAVINKIEEKPTEVFIDEPQVEDLPKTTEYLALHDGWDALLSKYVSSNGEVDYEGFKNSKTELEVYLGLLSKNSPESSWSREKSMAYWINAYNAHTIHLIINNYPLQSITDLDGGNPWKVKRISIGDKEYSLNNIEHDILRPQFKDPRIHFAVNCAAKSCPKVHNQAWTETNLEFNLTKLTKEFVNNPKANTINNKSVALSKIFEWYKSDFDDLIGFLNKYSAVPVDKNASVTFQDYDWDLNSK